MLIVMVDQLRENVDEIIAEVEQSWHATSDGLVRN